MGILHMICQVAVCQELSEIIEGIRVSYKSGHTLKEKKNSTVV